MKNRLKELRKQKGLTLRELAEIFNTSNQVVSRYELGQCEPDFETLCRLADFYGVSIDYILCRDSAPSTPRYFTEDPTLKAILDIYETLSPVQRGQLRAMADILKSSEKVKKY